MRQGRLLSSRDLAVGLGIIAIALGCSRNPNDPLKESDERPIEPSPNVSIAPAPLLSGESLVAKPEAALNPRVNPKTRSTAQSESRPKPPLPFSLNQEPASTTRTAEQNSSMLTLQAHFEWPGTERPLNLPGMSASARKRVQEQLRLKLEVELQASDRMRLRLDSDAFSLRRDTQLLARQQSLGHLLVWPDGERYRVLAQGALRALFSEARADVSPLSRGQVEPLPPGRRLGYATSRNQLKTGRGTLLIEQASIEGMDASGSLLCRFLLELVSMQPRGDVCVSGDVPLGADLSSGDGEGLRFVVDSLTKRSDGFEPIAVPPPEASFKKRGLPVNAGLLAAISTLPALGPGREQGTLELVNRSALGFYATLDGARIAFLSPRSVLDIDLPKPRVRVGLRGFLGDEVLPEQSRDVPGRLRFGQRNNDAGAP